MLFTNMALRPRAVRELVVRRPGGHTALVGHQLQQAEKDEQYREAEDMEQCAPAGEKQHGAKPDGKPDHRWRPEPGDDAERGNSGKAATNVCAVRDDVRFGRALNLRPITCPSPTKIRAIST